MKFPVGIQSFEKIIKGGFVYVDKTNLVYDLVSEGKIYFLSRPRRFGKSLLVSTLENYFLGKKELFKGLAIEHLETEWKTYPIFHLDFNGEDFLNVDALPNRLNLYLEKWENQYGLVPDEKASFGYRFAEILRTAHEQCGVPCVVLVDEYDKPILDTLEKGKVSVEDGAEMTLADKNRNILKGFFSSLKLADQDLQFVFLTGVTKFAKVSVFSGFNQPLDISKVAKYDTICGITKEEFDNYFKEPISQMAVAYGVTTDEMYEMLLKKYDGYHFSRRLVGVFNPFSLLSAFATQEMGEYWFSSGTPTYLVQLLNRDNVNLDEIAGRYYGEREFLDFKMDKDTPLPMLYQSGYLTIKGYNPRTNTYKLDVPNDEVKMGLIPLLMDTYLSTTVSSESWIASAIDDLGNGEIEKFMQELTAFLASIPYSMHEKQTTERFFHYTFYLIFRLASTYVTFTEKQQSQGRADCILETEKYVYIFEFKLDGSADSAMEQIKEKGYAKEYATDKRKVVLIGCSFSSKTRTVEEWKVE